MYKFNIKLYETFHYNNKVLAISQSPSTEWKKNTPIFFLIFLNVPQKKGMFESQILTKTIVVKCLVKTKVCFLKDPILFSVVLLIMSMLLVWGKSLELDSSSVSNANVFRGSYATFHSFSFVNSRCTGTSARLYQGWISFYTRTTYNLICPCNCTS